MIDFNLAYFGDAKLMIEVKGISAGIANIQFEGNFRVLLKNINVNSVKPDKIEIMFLEIPKYDFELLNAIAPLELFATGDFLRTIFNEVIKSKLVFPNKISIDI
jgi:hypothetical protein